MRVYRYMSRMKNLIYIFEGTTYIYQETPGYPHEAAANVEREFSIISTVERLI